MKVAIVHPWLLELGGAERVVDSLASIYPRADIFTIATDTRILSPTLQERTIYTSPINRLINGRNRYRRAHFMPLFPFAVESMDLSAYNLVISSCGPAVMGVNTRPDAVHIAYIHSPQRAWWDLYAKRQAEMSPLVRYAFIAAASKIRRYEFCAMQSVDAVVSNSRYIAQRVSKYFGRQSSIIYPPVDTSLGYLASTHDDFYFTASRLDIEKRIDLVIEACNRLKRPLKIAGTGRAEKRLRSLAGPTVEFLGRVSDAQLRELYARCRAFLFAADEDFGIVPVEAQCYGRPVVAYGHGGSLETVRVNDPSGREDTGVYFDAQTVESAMKGILHFEKTEHKFSPDLIQEHAQSFDQAIFRDKFSRLVESAIGSHKPSQRDHACLALAV